MLIWAHPFVEFSNVLLYEKLRRLLRLDFANLCQSPHLAIRVRAHTT